MHFVFVIFDKHLNLLDLSHFIVTEGGQTLSHHCIHVMVKQKSIKQKKKKEKGICTHSPCPRKGEMTQ